MRVRQTSGIRWGVGKRARAPRCNYMCFMLLKLYYSSVMYPGPARRVC